MRKQHELQMLYFQQKSEEYCEELKKQCKFYKTIIDTLKSL